MRALEDYLYEYWGFKEFRPLQKEIIQSVLQQADTLAILPTGGGKSLCYQIPALALQGLCLVVSPLIALMQDQVQNLQERGIAAEFLQMGMSQKQIHSILNKAVRGEYHLLYVSPERLQSKTFLAYAEDFPLGLIAVDEAHCISQWGHDFRPAYLKIAEMRRLFPKVPVIALTATATEQVRQDILRSLELRQPSVFTQTVVRTNLFYNLRFSENKLGDLEAVLRSVQGTGIVYCRSRKRTVETAAHLRSRGVESSFYHAGLNRHHRRKVQEDWMGGVSRVVCATTAFGMGIDKPDVRTVSHMDAPLSLEDYYQEAGRAGRDEKKAFSVLLFDQNDLLRLERSTDTHFPPIEFMRTVYQEACDFLQIAVGKGAEQVQAFDVSQFVHNFKLHPLKTHRALKLIERAGRWVWDEDAQTQATVQMLADRQELDYLERYEPFLAQITLGLLRLHGGIFHYATPMKIFDTSRLLRLSFSDLHEGLQRLHRMGLVSYQPAIYGSTLTLLHPRVRSEELVFDEAQLARLKEAHAQRVHHMLSFLQNDQLCRNRQIAAYFHEENTLDCGECDVCKRRKGEKSTRQNLQARIQNILGKDGRLSLQELTSHFPVYEQNVVVHVVRELADERRCIIDEDGFIVLR